MFGGAGRRAVEFGRDCRNGNDGMSKKTANRGQSNSNKNGSERRNFSMIWSKPWILP